MQIITSPPQASAEVAVNENFENLGHQEVYAKRHAATSALTWGYWGGRWGGNTIANGTLTLTNSATNYVVVQRSDGAISVSTATTNWNNTVAYARVYQITCAGGVVTAVVDARAGLHGVHAGLPRERRPNSQSAAYTLVAADAETYIFHPAADTTARIWTIPANASVAYPIGTELEFVNESAAGVITIAITTDTMRLAGAGTTGSRTLAANGWARAKKLTATSWIIQGVGLT